jgi:Transposase DDE domain/Transposase domain (DUF772)
MPILASLSTDEAADLPAVPPLLLALLTPWLEPLLAWFGAQVYRTVRAGCPTHPLVRLAHAYDPATVITACAPYQHQTGPGAPPTYPVGVLVRAEIVRVWAGTCSDPALEQLLASDLIVRWYVGLSLLGPTPDHSTLNRFHAWLTQHQPRALFADVLAFLDRVDPEDPRTTPQIVDTFALASPAAPTSAAVVLLRLCGQLADLWLTHAPREHQAALPPLDLGPLHAPPPARTRTQRQAQLQQAVTLARTLHDALTSHLLLLAPPLHDAGAGLLVLLQKVIADETTTDAQGRVGERPTAEKGSYRLASAVDVEATFRKHAPDDVVFGYNAAIATPPTRIRAALVLPGSLPDSEAPVPLLEQQRAAGVPLPPTLILDQAGGWGKTRAQVATRSDGQTQVVARIPQAGGADLTRFTPADFRVSPDGTTCRCPNGVVSTKAYPSGAGDGVHFRFTAQQCQGCPYWDHCRAPDSKPTSHRTVYVTPYHHHLRAGAAFNATPDGRALLGMRWQVEPRIAWLVRYDGSRRARRGGQAAAQCQLYQACAGRNLWRYLARATRRRAPAAGVVCP